MGANVIGGMSIGKTKHERPEQMSTARPLSPIPSPLSPQPAIDTNDELPF